MSPLCSKLSVTGRFQLCWKLVLPFSQASIISIEVEGRISVPRRGYLPPGATPMLSSVVQSITMHVIDFRA
jgi:hypothetical protein